MWIIIAMVVIALLMVLTAPKPNIENARSAKLGDFQFPRSKEGDPVPWFLGTVKLKSPNSIWVGDFNPYPIVVKQKTGMFSSKKVITGYKYHIGLNLAWALGGEEGVELLTLWSDNDKIFEGSLTSFTTININFPTLYGTEAEGGGLIGRIDFYPGTFIQSPNAYLQDKAHADVPGYVGQCHMVFRGIPLVTKGTGFYFGTRTNLAPISAEMRKLAYNLHPVFSVMPNGFDVNPLELLFVAMTQKWGMLSISVDDIDMDSWQRDAETLYNEDLGMSLLVQSSIVGKDIVEEVARIADVILYQDPTTGKIVSKLIRKDYDIEDLIIIDESIVRDLRSFSKTTWDGTYNQCRVTIKDRDNDYADKVSTSQDFALINYQQKIRNTDITIPGCFVSEQANRLGARQLSLLSIPLFSIEIGCNRKASLLKPGDCFIFNWAPYGLTNMVMRVQKIDLGSLTDGTVTINAVQDLYAVSTAVFSAPGPTAWQPLIGPLSPMENQALFELPYELSSIEDFIVSTFGSPVSTSDTGYKIMSGTTTGDINLTEKDGVRDLTPSATITGAYPATSTAIDMTGFAIDSFYTLLEVEPTVTDDELYAGDSIGVIRSAEGDEIVAFRNFTGTDVTEVIRGVYGSVPLNHSAGAKFYFFTYGYGVENAEEPYTVAPKTIYAKIPTYNAGSQVTLSSLTEMNITIVGKAKRPAVCGKVRVNGTHPSDLGTVTGAFVLTYAHRNRLDLVVRTQDEDSVTPEDNQHYNIRIYNNTTDTLLASALDTSATYATCRFLADAILRIEIHAVLDGLESYSKQVHLVDYEHGSETIDEILPDEDSIIFDGGGA